MYVSRRRESRGDRRGALVFALVVGVTVIAGCRPRSASRANPSSQGTASGRTAPTDLPRRAAPPRPSPSEISLSALTEWHREAAALAESHEGNAEGVAAARDAARASIALFARTGDPAWIATARTELDAASRRRVLPGACEALLDRARLEAVAADQPRAAHAILTRGAMRFGGMPRAAECVALIEEAKQALDRYPAPAGELAAIAMDPHADDPSVAAQPADASEDLERALAELDRRPSGPPTILRRLTTYAPERTERGGRDAGAGGAGVRIVLELSEPVAFRRTELPHQQGLPRRLAIDLPHAVIAPESSPVQEINDSGLLRARAVQVDEGIARVTLDLTPEARVRFGVLLDPFRIIADVELPSTEPTRRIVVIDPGHGGDDAGARFGTLRESRVALDLARRTASVLARRSPQTRVVLTRESDNFVTLEQRAAMANGLGASLFVSIHLNGGVRTDDEPGGIATFVLDTTNDLQALRIAAAENGTSVEEVSSLGRVVASLQRAEQVEGSRAVAGLVQRALVREARNQLATVNDRGVKSAAFYVLVGARMPAILVEASFITRPEEARALESEAYRDALANGIAEGIASYLGAPTQ